MTLPSAPASIAADQINTEMGFSSTVPLTLNDAPARTLAGLPTPNAPISFSDFYGKTAVFGQLANCYCGGWYMGCTTSGPATYYLIVAPVASLRWDNARAGAPCACGDMPIFNLSTTDGYCIQKCIQACPNFTTPTVTGGPYSYPVYTFYNGTTINGYSDWYIPANQEMITIWCNMDQAWRCGGPMKSSGNAFPICGGVCTCPAGATAPGCWPYLGYTAGYIAPGAASNLPIGCNSTWIPGNVSSLCYPSCPTSLTAMYHTTANQMCTIPTSPANFGAMAGLMMGLRFVCTQGWPNACTCFIARPKCGVAPNISMYRAVRRQLK
jgi:hypothetical protein